MKYEAQLRWKEDTLRQALRRIAHLDKPMSMVIHPAPAEFQYRYRVRIQIDGSATGFYRRSSKTIVPWDRCMLLPEPLNLIAKDLCNVFEDRAAPPALESCEAALSPEDSGITLNWQFKKAGGNRDAAARIMDSMEGKAAGIELKLAGQRAQDQKGRTFAERGGSLSIAVAGTTMSASPGTFFQVNPQINAKLVDRVLTHLRTTGITTLLDLYCGNGNLCLPAAAAGIKTLGVESSPGAIRDAKTAAGPRSRFVEMDVGRFLAGYYDRPDAVVLDPPRSGLSAESAAILGARRTPLLLYISCEPSTLARDLTRLTQAGYVIVGMELFDMFPQTSHLETLVVMKG